MAYRVWLNYDNDKQKYIFPVTPEKITCSVNGIITSLSIDKLGEVFHKGRREAITISWSSFFPAKYSDQYCSCGKKNFHTPSGAHKWILWMMNVSNPAHLVITGGPFNLNMYVVVKSYKAYEQGGDVGSINYTIELKEYRSVTVKKITKQTNTVRTTTRRVTNAVNQRVYTVKKGDTLRKIAKKYYGHKSKWKNIYKANHDVIHKAAKDHGYGHSHYGTYIFAGTKLIIP